MRGFTVNSQKCNILPSLIKVYDKYNIVSEASQSVRSWHGDDECKNIVYECIECLKKKKLVHSEYF